MRSITVHDIETELDKRLSQRARQMGLSLNKTIKGILADYLGMSRQQVDHSDDFAEFCGVWKKTDADNFRKKVHDLEQVNPGDWT